MRILAALIPDLLQNFQSSCKGGPPVQRRNREDFVNKTFGIGNGFQYHNCSFISLRLQCLYHKFSCVVGYYLNCIILVLLLVERNSMLYLPHSLHYFLDIMILCSKMIRSTRSCKNLLTFVQQSDLKKLYQYIIIGQARKYYIVVDFLCFIIF